ncbi:MAG: hypothetical protein V7K32_16820 [Nostoc sp.]|uniref:hypothetical protein n=1 Tax=Nostoc sp. TaxID=1180 RepID=UPI002FF5AF18
MSTLIGNGETIAYIKSVCIKIIALSSASAPSLSGFDITAQVYGEFVCKTSDALAAPQKSLTSRE